MTGNDLPANPSVLNTTVLSNFAYIDQLWVVADLSGICTVPVVREELEHGVDDHPYLQSALDTLDDEIPVATISDTVANREAVVSDHLDPGEAQAFALVDAADGRLLTDDGDARSFAKDRGVTVVGSVGCCWLRSMLGRLMSQLPMSGCRHGLMKSGTTCHTSRFRNIGEIRILPPSIAGVVSTSRTSQKLRPAVSMHSW
jgi:predicted nucleic acid-binding protein